MWYGGAEEVAVRVVREAEKRRSLNVGNQEGTRKGREGFDVAGSGSFDPDGCLLVHLEMRVVVKSKAKASLLIFYCFDFFFILTVKETRQG